MHSERLGHTMCILHEVVHNEGFGTHLQVLHFLVAKGYTQMFLVMKVLKKKNQTLLPCLSLKKFTSRVKKHSQKDI
jgi:hypothetical protein